MRFNINGKWENAESKSVLAFESIGNSIENYKLSYSINGIMFAEKLTVGLRKGDVKDIGHYSIQYASHLGFNFIDFLTEDQIRIYNVSPVPDEKMKIFDMVFERVGE